MFNAYLVGRWLVDAYAMGLPCGTYEQNVDFLAGQFAQDFLNDIRLEM